LRTENTIFSVASVDAPNPQCRATSVRELGIIVAAVFFAYIRAGWTTCMEYMLATAPQGKPPPLFLSSSF
jgi:hypothetical protein